MNNLKNEIHDYWTNRGRGYAGKILKKAEEIFNMPLVLVQAELELVSYYRKEG